MREFWGKGALWVPRAAKRLRLSDLTFNDVESRVAQWWVYSLRNVALGDSIMECG